jgi:hypothetical protein
MLTKDDLLAIGELLEPINKKLETIETNMGTKSFIEANNRVLGTLFKVELASITQNIVAVIKAGFQEAAKQIKRVEQKLDKVEVDHEDRIVTLEHGIFYKPQ